MPKRVDANQSRIVQVLRELGCSVQHLHEIGHGCPDILVGYEGKNFLLEIKDADQPPSKRKLTDDEESWHLKWKGQVGVVMSAYDAVEIIKKRSPVRLEGSLYGGKGKRQTKSKAQKKGAKNGSGKD